MNNGKVFFLSIVYLYAFTSAFKTSGQSVSPEADVFKDSTIVFAEISALGSSSRKTPFWMQANQFGMVSPESPATSLHGMFEYYRPIKSIKSQGKWRAGGAVEISANYALQSQFLFPQLHASLRYKNWEFFIGRKKQWVGLADSTMGSGSYSWSTNAMPIPKIQIGTARFVAIPMTNGLVSFSAFYSEGLFENNRPITSTLKLHQKMFYLRIGKISSRIKLYGGFNHQVQWGGKSPYQTINGQMPKGLANYFHVITGKPGDASKVTNEFDNGNRVGNHLGTIDLGLEIETFASSYFIYRQNIYEDGSLYALSNIKDGLNGIRMKRKNSYGAVFEVTEAVFEFLYTKSQGGAEFNVENYIIKRGDFGRDNYFNNVQVRDGWSYFNRTIGSPFITPTSDTDFKWPKHADSFTSNNRISVFHAGLKGLFLDHFAWSGKLSYSTNLGTYDVPFPKSVKQFSGIISVQRKLNVLGGTLITGSFAADIGQLYRPAYGAMIGIRKNFSPERIGSFL